MSLSKEKSEWLISIGAVEQIWEHFKYYVPSTEMHYSEEYLEKTPLAILQARHEKNLRLMKVD